MTRERKPGRQPLMWAALLFSAGLWVGVRAWRPATWWIVAVLAFAFAAAWFLRRRSWAAKGLSLGMWFLLGAMSIQIRSTPDVDRGLVEFADGREVTITGHVVRDGYARTSGPRSIRRPIDIETETIERAGQIVASRGGLRLTISEKVEDEETTGEPASAADAAVDSMAFARLKSCPSQTPPAARVGAEVMRCGIA
jgi:hypothetical protein